MFLSWAPFSISNRKKGYLPKLYRQLGFSNIHLSEYSVIKRYKYSHPSATPVVCSSKQANGSSPLQWSEEVERKRLYLERKYRFFEKQFATIQSCTVCNGSGKLPCKFCKGTGFMTLGDTLLCSVSGNCDCVVCKSQGEVDCEHCRGTGHIAGWL
ncbi:hypothetical protein GAYE_SCF01G1896 [Galdieria yellowstonensis]|uniref:Uncharacterized protein n=1 Tax=Galdieria yellowstonensis TaxID=3028027 RepID=A0AAV9I9J7_9RHOD|nr:hypothetical protein GAYE_SCF01G1896 [Galdieria yellowstonensis]